MNLKNTKDAFNVFYENLIRDSRANLSVKNTSGALSDSLNYFVEQVDTGVNSFLEMEDYGDFVDKGVLGVGGTKADGTRWKKKSVVKYRGEIKYKYKDKRPPLIALNGWTIRRGLAPRSSGGQFQSRRSLLFAIATSIYHTGLETTFFYSAPFDKYFAKFPDQVAEAYANDLDNYFNSNLENT